MSDPAPPVKFNIGDCVRHKTGLAGWSGIIKAFYYGGDEGVPDEVHVGWWYTVEWLWDGGSVREDHHERVLVKVPRDS